MLYEQLSQIHLWTILPALALGAVLLVMTKGTPAHRLLGAAYMVLMVVTSLVTLFMPARVGPALFGHFGLIHIFSVSVLISVPRALFAVRRGDIARHKTEMRSLYLYGMLIAFVLAFMPGRTLNHFLFG